MEVGPSHDNNDDDDKQTLDEDKQDNTEKNERASHNRNTQKEKLGPEHTSKKKGSIDNKKSSVHATAFEAVSNVALEMDSKNQCDKVTTKCYQLKIPRAKNDDFKPIVKIFHESRTQSVLDRIKLIEEQRRILDLWEILRSVNPRPIMMCDGENIIQKDVTLPDNPPDDVTFRKSSALCCFFEDLIKNFRWKVGDSLDIEDDICNVVGQLMMGVDVEDMSDLMKCIRSAMINIQAHGKERDGDKLSSLLISKKKYNGLNLACILLEQMILDYKDDNLSWMRIVCSQFIDLVCQLIIKPDYGEDVHSSLRYQEDVRWTLNHLLKLESKWTVWDIYNLMKNGILMFQDRPEEFHRNLVIIRNLAINPSIKICFSNKPSCFIQGDYSLSR